MSRAEQEIERARGAAAWTGRLGRVNIGIGVLAFLIGIVRYMRSEDPILTTLEIFLVVGIASVTSGVALIATSWNLRLSALRVELQAGSSADSSRP